MPKGYPRSVPGSLSGSERLQGDGGDQAPDGVVGYRAHVPAEDLSGRRRLRTISNDVINAARSAGKSAPMRLRPRRAVPSRWHGTTPRNSSRTLTWASTCPDLSEAAGGIEPPYGALQAPASLALGAGERANRGGVHWRDDAKKTRSRATESVRRGIRVTAETTGNSVDLRHERHPLRDLARADGIRGSVQLCGRKLVVPKRMSTIWRSCGVRSSTIGTSFALHLSTGHQPWAPRHPSPAGSPAVPPQSIVCRVVGPVQSGWLYLGVAGAVSIEIEGRPDVPVFCRHRPSRQSSPTPPAMSRE
jgi:hypothetical protein